jgi:hypothetical protein
VLLSVCIFNCSCKTNPMLLWQMAFNNRSNGLGTTLAKFKQHIFYSEASSRASAGVAYCFDTLWDSAYKIHPVK